MEGVGAWVTSYSRGLAGGLGVTVCAAAAAGGVLLYKIARRAKPTHTTVNCWFCNQDTVVPYGNRNCWDCPNCEQYNGFEENGDYNKPIPAQYMEHLNHVVSGAGALYDPMKPQQWVSSQVLLCKKCNNHQTMKIKQLASFTPREEGKYDEEIEVYKHHLEQTYKLCRPCQAAVEYYIKYQNRQLRALLLQHHFNSRKTGETYMQSFYASTSAVASTTPLRVILLRFLAFLSCATLVVMAFYGSGDPFSPATPPVPPGPGLARNRTGPLASVTLPRNGTLLDWLGWQEAAQLVPLRAMEMLEAAWAYGKNHQTAVVVLGLFTCVLAMWLAGRIRLRRIDTFASFLWLLVMGFHLAEKYLQLEMPSWVETAKFGTTSLCCLVGFAAAVATRKPGGQRRPRPRRYSPGDPAAAAFPNSTEVSFAYPSPHLAFIPTPPSVLQLMNQRVFCSPRRTSSSSLPGRLNRALSLGTIPSLARADSGYLFSGSRPPSQASFTKDLTASEYFSVISGSRVPSPAPSVAGSVASSSSSLRYRRPLISPARLNLKGQQLRLFSGQSELHHGEDFAPSESSMFAPNRSACLRRHFRDQGQPDVAAVVEASSICTEDLAKKGDSSSHSSNCVVDTTTREEPSRWKSCFGNLLLRGLLALSLTVNAIFTSAYLYQTLR